MDSFIPDKVSKKDLLTAILKERDYQTTNQEIYHEEEFKELDLSFMVRDNTSLLLSSIETSLFSLGDMSMIEHYKNQHNTLLRLFSSTINNIADIEPITLQVRTRIAREVRDKILDYIERYQKRKPDHKQLRYFKQLASTYNQILIFLLDHEP